MEKILTISSSHPWWKIQFSEIWQYRELLYFFSWRDLKVRYKQTVIGIFWAVLQPFITMIVFTIFFGNLAKIPSEGIPYPIFVYVGLLLWQLFSSSLTDIANSLVANQSIVTKVYFPRLILPFSMVVTHFVDFVISSFVLVILMAYYRYIPNLGGLYILPGLLLITCLSAIGLGLILAAINVKYRDVRYALPFFIQLLLFVTPVIYPASLLGKNMWLFGINPMAGVISTARTALFTTNQLSWLSLSISLAISLLLFIVGVIVFHKIEATFADSI